MLAPATVAPGATSTGTGSPVSIDWSTAEAPSTTTPSVATFSPGRTTKTSPTESSVTGTPTSTPSRSTRASRAPSSASARMASLERPRARSSSHRPSRIRRDHGRHLEIDVLVEPSEQDDRRPAPGGEGTERDERVHRRRQVARVRGSAVDPAPHHRTTGVEAARASHSQPPKRSGATMVRSTSGAVSAAAAEPGRDRSVSAADGASP
jgi:hypothetical protein